MTSLKKTFLLFTILALAVTGCASDEEKKQAHFEKGRSYYDAGKYEEAVLEFNNAVQIDPGYADALHMIGMSRLRQRKVKEAFQSFTAAAKTAQGSVDARVELAKLFLLGGALDKALAEADAVLGVDPENRDALLVKSRVVLSEKNSDEAIAFLEALLERGKRDPEFFLLLASAHAQNGDSKNFERVLVAGRDANPEAVPILGALAKHYARRGDLEATEMLLQKIVAVQPRETIHRFNLAGFYFDTARREDALETIEAVRASDPESEQNLYQIAVFFISKKRFDDAEKLLKASLREPVGRAKLRLLLARLYGARKKADQGIELLREVLAKDVDASPEDVVQLKNGLSQLYLSTRDMDMARVTTAEVLQMSPDNLENRFYRGVIDLYTGRLKEAVEAFGDVIAKKPAYVPAYVGLARSHIQGRDLEKAEIAVWKGLQAAPRNRTLTRAYAGIFAMKKDYVQAEAQLLAILEDYPADVAVRSTLGDVYYLQRHHEKAEAAYRECIRRAPGNPAGYLKLSRFFVNRDMPGKSIDVLREGLEALPEADLLLSNLVSVLVSQKAYRKAEALCRQRLAANPRSAFAHDLLGQVHRAAGNPAGAEKAFKEAISIQAMWPQPYNHLVRLYRDQGREGKAVADLKAEIAAGSAPIAAYLTLGMIYERKGAVEEAAAVYEKALAAEPQSWLAANNLAYLAAENPRGAGGNGRAIDYAKLAFRHQPENPFVLDTLGWVYYRQGDFSNAVNYLNLAVVRMPGHPVMNYHLGMALLDAGRPEEAGRRLDVALAAEGSYEWRAAAEAARKSIRGSLAGGTKRATDGIAIDSGLLSDDAVGEDILDDILKDPFEGTGE